MTTTPTTAISAPDPGDEADAPAAEPAERWFRGDIDGLRAIAIVAVVGFHAGVPGFGGGFVGVDVFFVISGFLITTKLLGDATGSERIRPLDFWAKRIRRLVPAMTAMVLATLAFSVLILSPREWPDAARSGGAAALYVSNAYFASADTSYFGRPVTESPFLHTWSLGVEEQFYLVWPLLIVLAAGVALRSRSAVRGTVAKALVGVVALSFVVELSLTASGSPWAFYGPQSRAWQFALAGLLATVAVPARWRSAATCTVAAVAGLALVSYSIVGLSDASDYPGTKALIPVLGTLLIIFGGAQLDGRAVSPAARALAHPSLQWLGRVSYSWYLWHWPFMILTAALLVSDTMAVRLGAAGASLIVAVVMYTRVESPIRTSARLRRSMGSTYLLALVATVVSVLAAVAVHQYAGATLTRPDVAALEAIADANRDYPCQEQTSPVGEISYCAGGDPNGTRTVLLTGDSHAGQWMAAFDAAASDAGIRLLTRWRGACPAIPVTITNAVGRDVFCDAYRADTAALVDEVRPDAVVATQSTSYAGAIVDELDPTRPLSIDDQVRAWASASKELVAAVEDAGARLVVIVDNPKMVVDPLACLGRVRGDAERCSATTDEAFGGIGPFLDADTQVREDHGLLAFDVTDDICDERGCHLMDGDVQVFANANHLAVGWTNTRIAEIRSFLEAAVEP